MSSTATVQFAGGPAGGETKVVPATMVGGIIRIAVPPKWDGYYSTDVHPMEPVAITTVNYVLLRRDAATGIYIYVPEEARAPRPGPGGTWRWCHECDVKWWGDKTCWCCEQVVTGR